MRVARRAALPAIAALLPALLAGCAAAPPAACPAGTGPATFAEAFFGRSAAGREVVDDAAWARFVDEVLTPAFPDGLTVLDGAGQWRGRDGRVARERSKLLLVALPSATPDGAAARLAPVTAAYRARFGQESVMVATRPGCVGF
ncbi:DUF3574 domain-containing protein [Falsiroseomonas sp. CW058]|uniref:DUF3574 domain-containing protein n=1 Tax=Falsiroseomonas sp. CW058 TaxID=3388664 RepID=UPI003D317C47